MRKLYLILSGILIGLVLFSAASSRKGNRYFTDCTGVVIIKYPKKLQQCRNFSVTSVKGDSIKYRYTSDQYGLIIETKPETEIIINFK